MNDVVSTFHIGNGCSHQEDAPRSDSNLEHGCCVCVCTFKRAGSVDRFLVSLAEQDRRPEQLIIVDASPDDETEETVKRYRSPERLANCILYFRVTGSFRGLTRQRNFALSWVTHDLIAFFDDDIVLRPGCLREMERVHRSLGDTVVGVAAYEAGAFRVPDRLWRLRRSLRIVSDLRPGSYQRSGMSVPWEFLPPTEAVVEGDWLPGTAVMWKSVAVREMRFCEPFDGYAQGEDLDFSLRARQKGKLVVAGAANLVHLHDAAGRPDDYRLGYMAIYNRYHIHRHGLENRRWMDVTWFIYAWSLDTLMLVRGTMRHGRFLPTLKQIVGRLHAGFHVAGAKRMFRE